MEQKFYEFTQNNSGGGFAVDDKLCHRLFIEATSEADAIKKAEDLGCYWDGCEKGMDCSCCGDRWYESPDSIELQSLSKSHKINYETVEQYAQHLADKYGCTKPDARLFYMSGEVVEIFKP